MPRPHQIQPVIRIVSLAEQPSDLSYWLSQPVEARIEALEQIRSEYNLWRYGALQRFQRVCSIVKR